MGRLHSMASGSFRDAKLERPVSGAELRRLLVASRPSTAGRPFRPNDRSAAKAEVAIPHPPGPGSVAAFDRTVQIVSDEFSAIKPLSCEIRILDRQNMGCRRCLTVRRLTDERANGCLENIDALEGIQG